MLSSSGEADSSVCNVSAIFLHSNGKPSPANNREKKDNKIFTMNIILYHVIATMKPSFLIATITIKSLFTDVWTTISLFSMIGANSCHCLSKTNHDNCYNLIVHWEVGWLSLFKERGFVIYEIQRSFIVIFTKLLWEQFKNLF